jgi:high-affinity iron transporter
MKVFGPVDIIGTVLLSAVATFRDSIVLGGNPFLSLTQTSDSAAVLNIGVLVFREGLECVLVLAAITASMTGPRREYRRSVAVGVGIGFLATLVTWSLAVRILDDLGRNVSALVIQAATGLLAVLVLLLVMNWFFHRVYWTGWISLHNKRKKELLQSERTKVGKVGLLWGMGLLGFTSFYREGFEVVLFLQSYRLKLGNTVVLSGVLLGVLFSGTVAVLTFVAHRKLPYKKMMVLTGLMLAVVLLVMVGEQAQEMQLAHWVPTTEISVLAKIIPTWMGLWFSIFPTVETLAAQLVAGILVFGSYISAQPSQTSAL